MKKYSNQQLKKVLRNKGIYLKTKDNEQFEKHDYYQVVNAYKGIFISGIETIDTIFKHIDNQNMSKIKTYEKTFGAKFDSANKDKFKTKILNSILSKYGITGCENQDYKHKLNTVKNQIKYKHHLYNSPDFIDFVRMYEFETVLRSVLLKHVLYIENLIKKVFIATLNDTQLEPDFFNDISYYKNDLSSHHDVLQCLQIIFGMQDKPESKAIRNRVDRSLSVPYWVLINEMTLNQTIKTIGYLKEDICQKVLINLFNEMCIFQIDDNSQKTSKGEQLCCKYLKIFEKALHILGDFRNTLAHNRPLYFYNAKGLYPNIEFDYPKPKGLSPDEKVGKSPEQIASIMDNKKKAIIDDSFSSLEAIFGIKPFGANNQFDLSYLIYLIDVILKKVAPKRDFKTEIQNIYKEYNIILTYGKKDYGDPQYIQDLIVKLDLLQKNDFSSIIGNLKEHKPYIQKLRGISKSLNEIYSLKDKIGKKRKKSDYNAFSFSKQYTAYTGVDYKFLTKL